MEDEDLLDVAARAVTIAVYEGARDRLREILELVSLLSSDYPDDWERAHEALPKLAAQ